MEPTFTFEELKAGDPARLFLVDAHLHDPPARQHSFTPTFTGQETIIMTEQNAELRKRFKHCYYKVDSFSDVRVVWPMKWPAPAPNRLGWLPKLEFGNPEVIHEQSRDVWLVRWLEHLRRDVRIALRAIRSAPGFSAAVIATLALGIGANTAMFTVVDAALLRVLPQLPAVVDLLAIVDHVGAQRTGRRDALRQAPFLADRVGQARRLGGDAFDPPARNPGPEPKNPEPGTGNLEPGTGRFRQTQPACGAASRGRGGAMPSPSCRSRP
mgnify:CR=1 FL=1